VGSDVLAGLSDAQADVVRDPALPLGVVAGPGAGKTRVLTRRIAWRCERADADPEHTLVLTFSRRAANELRARLVALGLPARTPGGVVAGTFHAVAWAQVSRHRADRGQPPLGLVRRAGALARPPLATALGRDPAPAEVRALLDEVAWARRQGGGPAQYASLAAAAGRWPPWPLETVAAAWEGYVRAKERRLVLDLDDLLDTAAALVEDDAEAAAAVRWRHRHVYVDEYQDLNPVHLRLLRAWAGARNDLCIVGDPDQAVYGFNGACPELFARIRRDWPGIKVVRLAEDFRSTPEVVAVTEALRPGDVQRLSRRPPGTVPKLVGHRDEDAEAAAIASAVWARHASGTGWKQMAVLARTNARLRGLATALTREGVPWRLRDRRPLSERPTCEEWLDQHDPAADVPQPPAVEDPDLDALRDALEEYRGHVRRATVAGFRAWLDASGPADDEPSTAGVDLVTFHRAKGLEWDEVWVAGVEDGTVPLSSAAATEPGLAEESRLLYVALTRAGRELTVSWAGEPSRWVTVLAAASSELSCAPEPAELQRRASALRAALRDAAPGRADGDDAGGRPESAQRRAALLSWRGARARAAAVPPEVVLPDAVVAVIATSQARTPEEVVASAPSGGRRVGAFAAEIAAALAVGRTA
jgi:DNA helicase-2/ATP-dependent DNA helicase PcrA